MHTQPRLLWFPVLALAAVLSCAMLSACDLGHAKAASCRLPDADEASMPGSQPDSPRTKDGESTLFAGTA